MATTTILKRLQRAKQPQAPQQHHRTRWSHRQTMQLSAMWWPIRPPFHRSPSHCIRWSSWTFRSIGLAFGHKKAHHLKVISPSNKITIHHFNFEWILLHSNSYRCIDWQTNWAQYWGYEFVWAQVPVCRRRHHYSTRLLQYERGAMWVLRRFDTGFPIRKPTN